MSTSADGTQLMYADLAEWMPPTWPIDLTAAERAEDRWQRTEPEEGGH